MRLCDYRGGAKNYTGSWPGSFIRHGGAGRPVALNLDRGEKVKNLPFVKASDVEGEFRTPPRTSKLLLAPKFGGVNNVSMGMNITEVGSMIPDHVHEESEEVLFLISGKARIVIEGEGEYEIGPETAFYSPLGKKHRVENIGDEPLRIVWVYSPPLPAHKA
jgi:putative monooxygenase